MNASLSLSLNELLILWKSVRCGRVFVHIVSMFVITVYKFVSIHIYQIASINLL